MLKSTHKAAPLPSGWTEHRAPSGHLYYYNTATKQSTYTRPITSVSEEPSSASGSGTEAFRISFEPTYAETHPFQLNRLKQPFQSHSQQYGQHQSYRRPPPEDRPKHKQKIPGAIPWILVRTKLHRRFVHNPDTGESLWKFPADVMKCVMNLDREERERKERHRLGEFSEGDDTAGKSGGVENDKKSYDSEEYEEFEVTDEEEDAEGENMPKRLRTEGDDPPTGPVEFGEDDIEFQLAQLEAESGNYEQDYNGQNDHDLSQEDARALFCDLLDDFKISPYTPWDSIIMEGRIIDDDRYTVLPNMKTRHGVFDEWSRWRIAEHKERQAKQAEQDPRIPYMTFLSKKATPKLYWQEFRRKFQKEPEMKDRKLADKDREKWYREHISRLKLSESDRKRDLRRLLEEIPVHELNRNSNMSALPGTLLRDVRYISLPEKVRDPLIEAFIEIAPPAPENNGLNKEEEERRQKDKSDRERRERALADREKQVRQQQSMERKELGYSKGLLRDEEVELQRAMKIGREGLLSHLRGKENPT